MKHVYDNLAAARIVLLVTLAALGVAWCLQLFADVAPCELCLYERVPYYLAVALLAPALLRTRITPFPRISLVLTCLLLLTTAAISGYHTGVEWHWWPGPSACSGPASAMDVDTRDLLAQIRTTQLTRCDEPQLVVMGLSLAGWNTLLSVALAVVALTGALPRHSAQTWISSPPE